MDFAAVSIAVVGSCGDSGHQSTGSATLTEAISSHGSHEHHQGFCRKVGDVLVLR
jgi:hypothetical protein